jgi:hypothetical protein
MRLLNSTTFELKEFYSDIIPKYAILSHTWETEEVRYEDMIHSVAKSKKGYIKIEFACKQAQIDKLDWVWVDT